MLAQLKSAMTVAVTLDGEIIFEYWYTALKQCILSGQSLKPVEIVRETGNED